MQRFRVVALAVVTVVGTCAAARAGSTDEPMAGQTIVVGKGVSETVQQIMDREAALVPEPFRVRESKPEHPALLKRGRNPGAPAVSSWPPGPRPGGGGTFGEGTLLPQVVGTSFLGARIADTVGFVPPDSMGDVGPSQVMVAVNGRIRVFDKAGALGGLNTTTSNFFSSVGGVTNGTTDPHVRYDRLSQRWFVSIITVFNCPNDVLLAVSSGPVITSQSSFTLFRFQGEAGGFADYDTLGVDRFALYIGANVFNCGSFTFKNTSVWVVNKANLLAGTLTATPFRGLIDLANGAGIYTPQGVGNDDPQASQGYFVGVDAFDFNELVLHRVNTPGGTPTLSTRMTLVVPTTTLPIAQIQPAGPTLDALDDRLFAAQVHTSAITGARTLWTAHNIEVNAGGVGQPGGGRNGSRWYEIGGLTATPTLVQAGTLFDAGSPPFGYWIPSVAMSRQGHMGLVAGRAGANATTGFASVVAAGRLRTDTPGSTRAPTLAQGSSTFYDTTLPNVPERWGDYSQVGIDPTDGQTMWTFQEYCDALGSWGVRAVQLLAPPPATPATASPSTIGPGLPSVSVVIMGTTASGAEFFDPGADTGGPGFPGRIRAAVTPAVTVNSVVFDGPGQVTLNVSTVGATPGAKNVTVTNPDGQARTGSGILTVACPVVTVQPPTIPGAILGAAYTQTFTQSGGLSPVTFGLTGGLPAGMSFSAGTATLSGTPTQGGSFPFTVNVTDAAGCTGSRGYTLVVSCPPLSVNPLTLPTGAIGAPYTQVFTGSGATSALTFNQTGPLPAGLSFSPGTATLSGTPTQSGAFLITVGITDAFACTASRAYNLAIADATALTPTALAVDAAGNGVLEPNQAVVVDPSWTNQTGGPVDLTGTASSFIGPASATYTIVDGTAAYGTIADGAVGRCSTAGGDCYSLSITAASRPATHWDTSFVESLSTGGPKAWTLHVGGGFTDVPSTSPFYRFIEILFHRGITAGCGAATYCPSNPTTREAMAVFVLVAKEGTGYAPPACGTTPLFTDVPVSSPFCRWIEELSRRGVVSGCGGGNYCPTSPVTREQMAIFVLRTLDPALSPPACTTPLFADVPASSPFCRWIEELSRRGVVSGCGGGNYCPTSPVTREQMGVFISATFGLTLYGA